MTNFALEVAHCAKQMKRAFGSALDVNFDVEAIGSQSFAGQIGVSNLGRIAVGQLALSPHRTRRAALKQPCGASRFLFNCQVSGRLSVYQDGRATEIGPGDMYLLNPSRDFELDTDEIEVNVVAIDKQLLRQILPEAECCSAIRIPKEGAGALLSATVDNLVKWAPTLDSGALAHVNKAIPYLMGAALSGGYAESEACPSSMHLLLKQRIKAFAREHLADPDLCCAMIANGLNLSQRYIYDILADEPITLMRWIRRERLARCRRELSSAVLMHRSISEIAYSWGFVELAHFSRAFSTEFGMSPRAYRQAHVGTGARMAVQH